MAFGGAADWALPQLVLSICLLLVCLVCMGCLMLVMLTVRLVLTVQKSVSHVCECPVEEHAETDIKGQPSPAQSLGSTRASTHTSSRQPTTHLAQHTSCKPNFPHLPKMTSLAQVCLTYHFRAMFR